MFFTFKNMSRFKICYYDFLKNISLFLTVCKNSMVDLQVQDFAKNNNEIENQLAKVLEKKRNIISLLNQNIFFENITKEIFWQVVTIEKCTRYFNQFFEQLAIEKIYFSATDEKSIALLHVDSIDIFTIILETEKKFFKNIDSIQTNNDILQKKITTLNHSIKNVVKDIYTADYEKSYQLQLKNLLHNFELLAEQYSAIADRLYLLNIKYFI